MSNAIVKTGRASGYKITKPVVRKQHNSLGVGKGNEAGPNNMPCTVATYNIIVG